MGKVDRAIFLAAGMGTRMAPVTEKLPKPLVRVHGKRIIDTLLQAVVYAGINEIYIIRGYMAKKFDELKEEYPQITFIENPEYYCANNISSLVKAGNLVENAYIIESDLFLCNPALITPCQRESNYLAIPVQKTEDWCFFTDRDGYIDKMAVGGSVCQQMVGISYWTFEDGRKLAQCAMDAYQHADNGQLYWDQIALEYYRDQFRIRTRSCTKEDVIEIDTFAELCALDNAYSSAFNGDA